MFTPIKSAPPGIIALDATGKITDSDYKTVLIPAIEAAKKTHDKISLLIRFGPEYDGYTPHAMLDDTMLGLTHWNDFNRVAVVTDVKWIVNGLHMFAPLIPATTRRFPVGSLDEALTWTAG